MMQKGIWGSSKTLAGSFLLRLSLEFNIIGVFD